MKLQGVELKTAEPLRVSLQQGIARLEQVHITGQDTDMRASGTAQLLGVSDAKGGKLDVSANGSVSMALLHTFDTDITSSGKVEFTVNAGGKVMDPRLTGTVKFDNVNASIEGIAEWVEQYEWDAGLQRRPVAGADPDGDDGWRAVEDRRVDPVRNGVYADLTATGDVVRVRLYGLSATANANLKLQGGTRECVC